MVALKILFPLRNLSFYLYYVFLHLQYNALRIPSIYKRKTCLKPRYMVNGSYRHTA